MFLRDPGVASLFTRVPVLDVDIAFEDIDLEELTASTELGRVSGLLRGSVEGLSIADGQPVAFDATVETVPRRGVAQRVSFDAIRQISIIGGSGRDPLVSGLLQFFGDYRYAKMGFHCSLRKDHFRLRGIETHAEKDYLVVGTWMPPRVNVVSYRRDISFSQMLARLETVGGVGQDSKDGGPQ